MKAIEYALESICAKSFGELSSTRAAFFTSEIFHKIAVLSTALAYTFSIGSKLILAGNGGSAADAQHIAAEFVGRFRNERPSMPAISLTADSAVLTALSNDYRYESVFERQLNSLCKPTDMLWLLSTSGKSSNIVNSYWWCKYKRPQRKVIVMTGDNFEMMPEPDYLFSVPSKRTDHIQTIHIELAHLIVEATEWMMYGSIGQQS